MKKKLVMICLILALVILLAGAGILYRSLAPSAEPAPMAEPVQTESEAPEQEIELAPDFTVVDLNGEELRLSDLRGTPVVVNFWATWCPPCREELPAFDAACAAYEGRVRFVMVDLTDGQRETQEVVEAFLDETGYSFPVYLDTAFEGVLAYQVNSIPLSLFIDAEGRLADSHLGSMDEKTLQAYLDKLC